MTDHRSVMAVIRAARPILRNSHDKVAFAVHSAFLASGYVLTATGPAAFSDDALSTSGVDEVGVENWNEAEDERGEKVLVKCLAMDDLVMVDVLSRRSSEPLHCEINVRDCVEESGGGNYAVLYKNMDRVVKTLNECMLRKMDGFTRNRSTAGAGPSQEGNNKYRRGTEEPNVYVSGRVDLQIHPSGVVVPGINPERGGDRFPGPGAGTYPTRGRFDGDMIIGPNDPRWGGSGSNTSFPGGGLPGVPPGARFDPYGPPGVPGFEPNRFVRDPRRPPGRHHPDLEQPGPDPDYV